MSDHQQDPVDPTEIDLDGMGVSSERIGPTGPGQVDTHGVRDTSAADPDADVPPEQRPGAVETNPNGLDPVAAPPSLDPRSDETD